MSSAVPTRILRLLASDGRPRFDRQIIATFPVYRLRSIQCAVALLLQHRLATRGSDGRVTITELGTQIARNPQPPRWSTRRGNPSPTPPCGKECT